MDTAVSTNLHFWRYIFVCLQQYDWNHRLGSKRRHATLLVVPVKQLPFGLIVCRIIARQERQFHQSAMRHQEHQHVHYPVPDIVELPLLNRPWNCSADRLPLQDQKGRYPPTS